MGQAKTGKKVAGKTARSDGTKSTQRTAVTQHTQTQALNDDAKKELEKDVESAKSADPIFVIIRGNAQGKKHSVAEGETIMGRSRAAAIRILDPSVSGQHLRIFREGERVFIEDMGSNNGTFLNNEKVTGRHILEKEDMVTVGTTILKFVPAGELEILYHGNLIKAAYVDRLTGVYNNNYVMEALEAEFKRAKALNARFSLIMIDLDHFKEINDGVGHLAGDFVLREFCSIVVTEILRPNETMGRYGGDEFLVLLWNTTRAEAVKVAERIQARVADHDFSYEGQRLQVTVSLGVAQVGRAHKSVKDFISEADRALYRSKGKGRNAVSIDAPDEK